MKKSRYWCLFIIVFICLAAAFMIGCNNEAESSNDYPVEGIWHANTSWHVDNPYNYGGDTYTMDIYFNFLDGGAVRYRGMTQYNNSSPSDSGWILLNMTWSVSGNVITLSSGKTYVIYDDVFEDLYSTGGLLLHLVFSKE